MASLDPGSPLAKIKRKGKEGESLEDLAHVLDVVGRGLTKNSISGLHNPRVCDYRPRDRLRWMDTGK